MRRGTWRKIALTVAAFAAADVLAALVLPARFGRLDVDFHDVERVRCRHDFYHHGLVPLLDTHDVWGLDKYRMATNSLGMKDAAPRTVPAATDLHRVVLLGDSFTEGLGVPFEETFAGLLAARLRPRGVDVLNAGVSSASPSLYYSRLRFLLERDGLDVDEILVFVDTSDVWDEANRYVLHEDGHVTDRTPWTPDWERTHDLTAAERVADTIKSWSVAARALSQLKNRLRPGWSDPDAGIRPFCAWTLQETDYADAGLARAKAAMDRLRSLAEAHGIAVTVVVFPMPVHLLHDAVDSRQVTEWRDWCSSREVPFVNLFPTFFTAGETDEVVLRYYLARDTHFNAAGHALVADEVLRRWQPHVR